MIKRNIALEKETMKLMEQKNPPSVFKPQQAAKESK